MSEQKPTKWYQKKELYGIMAVGGLIGSQFPDNTVVFQVGVVLNGLIAIGLTWFGVKDGYEHNNLPGGLTKTMDNLPDFITGVKGSKATINVERK